MEEQNCYTESISTKSWTLYMKEESASSLQAKECSEKATARRRLDPRVSLVALVLLNVIAFSASSLWVLVAAIAMDTVLLIWCGKPKLAFYWLLGYAALNAIWYGCVAAGPAFNPFGACFLYMSKIIPAAMFASAMISTTHTGELAFGLQSFGIPSRVTVATCVALRFFPTIGREAHSVREAMALRNERFSLARALRHPGEVFECFIVPFVHRISIVADELGDAITCRGADTSRKRTSYYDMRLGIADYIVVLILAILLAWTIAGRIG